jgi:hypothetical protein
VQSVYTPNLTRAPALALLAVLACAALLVLTVPQAHHHATGPRAPSWVALIGGMPLQQARCEQWLGAPQSERNRALDALQGVVGGPTPFGRATALTPAEGERLFDRTCSNPIARNFLLYELYTRASGFRSLVDPKV